MLASSTGARRVAAAVLAGVDLGGVTSSAVGSSSAVCDTTFRKPRPPSHRPKSVLWTDRLYRLPALVLPDPLGAIVEKELRSLVRTPRFRLVFVMGFSFGLVVWLPMMLRGRVTHSAVSGNFLTVVSLYALFLLAQVTYGNAFGFDRSAAQTLFLSARSYLARAGRQEYRRRDFHLPGDRGGSGCLFSAASGHLRWPDRRGVSGDRHRRVYICWASAI